MLYLPGQDWTLHRYYQRRSIPQIRREILSRLRFVLTTIRCEDGDFLTVWNKDRNEVAMLERLNLDEREDGYDICAWCFRVYPCHELMSADYELLKAVLKKIVVQRHDADTLSICETCLTHCSEDKDRTARERVEMWIRFWIHLQFWNDKRRLYVEPPRRESLQSAAKEEAKRLIDIYWPKDVKSLRCMYTRAELDLPWSTAHSYRCKLLSHQTLILLS